MAALELPPYIRDKRFELNYAQQLTPSGEEGFIQTLNRSAPFWQAEYSTPGLSGDRENEWLQFTDGLEGALGTFLAYDPRRPMPYAYRAAPITDDPWTQTGQVAPRITAQDYALSTINLDRLQNGAVITVGDYISVQVGIVWYLFRATTGIASVVGNAAIISVKPRPNIVAFAATNIRYRRACAEMKMVGKPDTRDSVDDLPTYTIRATQYTARVPS